MELVIRKDAGKERFFDFTKSLTPDLRTFRNGGLPPGAMYRTARMRWVFSQAAPSLDIKLTDEPWDMPFSVKLDKEVDVEEVMRWHRSHFEGTPMDMTLGALAGPWSSPNRVEGGQGKELVPGIIPRAMSIQRTTYVFLGQSGPGGYRSTGESVAWFCPDAPASSVRLSPK